MGHSVQLPSRQARQAQARWQCRVPIEILVLISLRFSSHLKLNLATKPTKLSKGCLYCGFAMLGQPTLGNGIVCDQRNARVGQRHNLEVVDEAALTRFKLILQHSLKGG